MKSKSHSHNNAVHINISWIFALIFLSLGILNLIFIHPIPALFYVLLALFYFPFLNELLYKSLGFTIPLWIKTLAGLLVIWGTMAVGDLMELFEAWMLK
ncbi:hypothetical protein [Muriicola soli]|uniref:Uncharacterized protein n=1 Tax=Muriicola soli TaxID=2507538 RepID=A0A411E927_9FLAO|nr:hypothetical protein [Muriicola soli]QBA64034.1 hypothetical protein EQY75_05475 [Muriicola soli]